MNLKLKDLINADLFRYYGKTGWLHCWKIRREIPGFAYTYIMRKTNYYRENIRNPFNLILFLYNNFKLKSLSFKYGFQIPYNTKIGPGFYINHFGRTIINGDVVIGKNCNIFTGVTIGQEYRGKREGCPIIGNSVWIGPNSVIVGRIIIGDNVLIAPNTYINFDIPSNSIVVGNPAMIKPNIHATDKYIYNVVD